MLKSGGVFMKKACFTVLTLSFVFIFSSCVQNGNLNLSSFIEKYNELSIQKITYTDFSCETVDEKSEYGYMPNPYSLIKLICDNDNIEECKVILSKYKSENEKTELSADDIEAFKSQTQKIVQTFTNFDISEINAILSELFNDFETAEKTVQKGDYYFIYISNELCCEVILRNNLLKETETTEKPENKNSFSVTNGVRTETVPHR